MRARWVLAVILSAFAVASVIAALTTIRQVRIAATEPASHLHGLHHHPARAELGGDGHDPVQLAMLLAAPL
jgi:hypothetical protein